MSKRDQEFSSGSLVGFRNRQGRFCLGVIQGVGGARRQSLLDSRQQQRSVDTRQLQLLHPTPCDSPVQGVAVLRQAEALAEELQVDEIETVWELLSSEAEPQTVETFSTLLWGREELSCVLASWRWLMSEQDWFSLRKELVHPLSCEERRRRTQERARCEAEARQTEQFLEAARAGRRLDPATATGDTIRALLTTLEQRALGTAATDPGHHDRVLDGVLRLRHGDCDALACRRLLVELGHWRPQDTPAARGSLRLGGFSAALLEAADELAASAAEALPADRLRRDLSQLHSVTIDDPSTRDLDDAVALERGDGQQLRIWIHVADPAARVAPGTVLDLEAARRGSSVYTAEATVPMFPPQLSEDHFSLRAGQRRRAFSFWAELDDDGAITASGFTPSWVMVNYRLSYDEVDELLELAPPQEDDLLQLDRLARLHRQWRLGRGALLLDQPEPRFRPCDAGQGGVALEILEPTPARRMVAELMLLAGSICAAWGAAEGVALPFRGQPACVLPSEAELARLSPGPVRHAAVKRCLVKGATATSPQPHFALGLAAYVQATSPIRRYGDLLVQRQLWAHLLGDPPLSADQLNGQLGQVLRGAGEALQIAREDHRFWMLTWLQSQQGPWCGVFLRWLREDDGLGLVLLADTALELPARCPADCRPDAAVRVLLRQVDPIAGLLRLEAGLT